MRASTKLVDKRKTWFRIVTYLLREADFVCVVMNVSIPD